MKTKLKTLILMATFFTLGTVATYAQCDKKVKFTSSKTDHVDAAGNISRTEDEEALVQIGKSTVSITVNGESKGVYGITSQTCDWKVPFKEGKTTIKAAREDMNISLVIEGKGGKVTAYFVAAGREDDGIRVTTTKFEEDL